MGTNLKITMLAPAAAEIKIRTRDLIIVNFLAIFNIKAKIISHSNVRCLAWHISPHRLICRYNPMMYGDAIRKEGCAVRINSLIRLLL